MTATATALIGINRLVQDLCDRGYPQVSVQAATDFSYAVIPGFIIPAGSFAGRVIDLAIPATTDYPRSFPASMHIRATPHLVPFGSLPNGLGGLKRNVIPSSLGADWQYWSYRFDNQHLVNPTGEILSQINECFRAN